MRSGLAAILLGAALLTGGSASAQTVAEATSAQPILMMVHVRVADMARSEHFYNQVFGMSVTNAVSAREHVLRFPNATGMAPGVILLLADQASPPNGGFLVQVPDIDATFARVEGSGGTVVRAPRDTQAPVRSGFITDPDGARIEVMQFIRR